MKKYISEHICIQVQTFLCAHYHYGVSLLFYSPYWGSSLSSEIFESYFQVVFMIENWINDYI